MSVRQHRGKWLVDIRDRKNNLRIRRTVGTRREGQQLEATIRSQIQRQKIPNAGIEQALTEYLKGEAKMLKDYNGLLSKARAIRPYITGQTFDAIGTVAARIKKEMIGQNLKPATINRRLALLRRLGNLAFEWGWIDHPAGKRIKLLPGETERHYYLTMQQVQEFAKLCPKTGAIIKIAAMTGLRRKELQNLQPQQLIKDENNAVTWIALNTDTKSSRPRMVPVPSIIRPLFNEYTWPLDRSYNQLLRTEFEAARTSLGMPHIRYHDLRHSYASFLIQHGAGLKQVGELMGHSNTQMTNRYSHLMDEHLMELAEKFGDTTIK